MEVTMEDALGAAIYETSTGVRNIFEKARKKHGKASSSELPGYASWQRALDELSGSLGVDDKCEPGRSVMSCIKIVQAGGDPKQLIAIATLIFG